MSSDEPSSLHVHLAVPVNYSTEKIFVDYSHQSSPQRRFSKDTHLRKYLSTAAIIVTRPPRSTSKLFN
ncbi:hypothetical protein J6590_007586 [Homalodisca vitripennis]|nr:hypothetical protein J6590_007586 [Homalodisca vitripennis]